MNRASGQRGNVEDITNGLKTENLRDPKIQEELIDEYLKDFQVPTDTMEKVYDLNRVYNKIIEEKGLKQQSDPKKLEKLIDEVIKNNHDKVKEYKSGKEKLFGFFVGQVMKASSGKANPQLVNQILKNKLK